MLQAGSLCCPDFRRARLTFRSFFVSDSQLAETKNWTNRPLHFNIAPSMSKDTIKALVIILGALSVLVILLLWANHLRPHA